MPPTTDTDDAAGPIIEVNNPDYHLSPDSPLWAATHVHTCAGPPAISIHVGLEVGIVLAGKEEMQFEGYRTQGDPGDVWFCAMSEPHRGRILQPNTVNLAFVFLPIFLGEEMLGDKPWLTLFAVPPAQRPRMDTPELRSLVLTIAADLRREVEARRDGWQCSVRLDLLRILFHLSREWRFSGSHGARRDYLSNLHRIMPALALVYEVPPRAVSREEAARACSLGPSRFTMLFRETMGVSYRTFRRRVRIAFAANLLLTTTLPVDAIATRSGFSDASHLHRSFVLDYGCTPGGYREQRLLPVVTPTGEQTDPWSEPGSLFIRQAEPQG